MLFIADKGEDGLATHIHVGRIGEARCADGPENQGHSADIGDALATSRRYYHDVAGIYLGGRQVADFHTPAPADDTIAFGRIQKAVLTHCRPGCHPGPGDG